MTSSLAEVLGTHLQRTHTSVNRLAIVSGVPQRTIANWLDGHIRKPQQWQALLKVAIALYLTPTETNTLLKAAGHLPLAELAGKAAADTDRTLFAKLLPAPPFQAVTDLPTFVGRTSELDKVKCALLNGGRAALCGLHGMGGVGKTTLAAHLTYQLRDYFADGVLWAQMDTTDTLSILATFADAYGKDVSQYKDVDSRAAVVRTLLADKRVLIVLDNAQNSAQVRPLLPPSTGRPAILITSRHDLEVTDGWARLAVEPFAAQSGETLALFGKFLEAERVQENREALLEIGHILGYLPLALAITAGKLAADPERTAVSYAALLCQNNSRLGELTREDRSVRLTFDVSFTTLSPDLQQVFVALGAFDGEDFGVAAIAYVANVTEEIAQIHLRQLGKLSLVQEGRYGRYRLHPLLRDYAREKLAITTNKGESYYTRMSKFYIEQALLLKNNYAALSLELDNILAMLETAVIRQTPCWLIKGFIACADILLERGLYPTMRRYSRLALAATRATEPDQLAALLLPICRLEVAAGNRPQATIYAQEGLALAQNAREMELVAQFFMCLSQINWFNGDQPAAQQYLAQCEPLARELKLHSLVLRARHMQGIAALTQNNFTLAEQFLQEVLQVARAENHAVFMVNATIGLGMVAQRQHYFQQAESYYHVSLTIEEEFFHTSSFTAFQLLGTNALAWGKNEEAEAYLQKALVLAKQDNHLRGMAAVLRDAGDVAQVQNNETECLRRWHEAIQFAQQADLKGLISEILCRLGEWHFRHGETAVAETTWREALTHAQTIKSNELMAKAFYGLARVSAAFGESQQAVQTARQSLALFKIIDHRYATEVQQWLTKIETRQTQTR